MFLNFLNIFFRHQGPRDLLKGLMISFLIVSRVNGMVINILKTPALAIFGQNLIIFSIFLFVDLWAIETI